MKRHHHGATIKDAREKRGMTQARLAEVWPKGDGGTGVTVGMYSLLKQVREISTVIIHYVGSVIFFLSIIGDLVCQSMTPFIPTNYQRRRD